MTGPIGLHGGGEYLAGDERFLDALLEAAAGAAGVRSVREAQPVGFDVSGHSFDAATDAIRVVILPTAAGRGRPDRAAAIGRSAFERRAAATSRRVIVDVARVVDAASAADPAEAHRLPVAPLIPPPRPSPPPIPSPLPAL